MQNGNEPAKSTVDELVYQLGVPVWLQSLEEDGMHPRQLAFSDTPQLCLTPR